jgi:hypothetical protein
MKEGTTLHAHMLFREKIIRTILQHALRYLCLKSVRSYLFQETSFLQQIGPWVLTQEKKSNTGASIKPRNKCITPRWDGDSVFYALQQTRRQLKKIFFNYS